jgi:acetoin utilization deacetylase AcuC-like enzyme/GNAT superfamily N-acetyltransferase
MPMFRIRRLQDDVLPVNRIALEQVKGILREQIPGLAAAEINGIGKQLRDPMKHRFRTILYVADRMGLKVSGFALVMYEPQLRMFYLDYIATATGLTSRGIGGAIYQHLRDEARRFGCRGIFLECLPDDRADCPDGKVQAQNRARLRFYEHFGARPLAGTAYNTPLGPKDGCPPYLVFDGLDSPRPPRRKFVRQAVRAILVCKYRTLCPPAYVKKVVDSIQDDPVNLRPMRYLKEKPVAAPPIAASYRERIALVINDKHDIHHVRDRGYVESPVRVHRILTELQKTDLFEQRRPREHSLKVILAVHDGDFVNYLRRVCARVPADQSIYPYVFPIRNATRPPVELPVRAGYYCIDTFTPLNQNAFLAARRAVDCALTAAAEIVSGRRLAYALVRPPGHHAERRSFGGFCYFNNVAAAAQELSRLGKVAILDIDYHHGNGQQDIFYGRRDVLTVSIHGHPRFAYPYFSGFDDETGRGSGKGFNLNLPLAEKVDGESYRRALNRALNRIREFGPVVLVVALGLDTAKGDPTGTWNLGAQDFTENGRRIGRLQLPTLVVQEGGYRTRTLGVAARHFFIGLQAGAKEL